MLRATVAAKQRAGAAFIIGVPKIAEELGVDENEASEPLADALYDLQRIGLVEFKSQWQVEISQEARKIQAVSLRTSWKVVDNTWLDDDQEQFMRAVCELSEQRAADYAWLEVIHAGEAFDRLGWDRDNDRIADLVFALRDTPFLDASRVTMGGGWNIFPTYLGIVRATEARANELQQLVAGLLPSWETANVDFKRELHLRTKDEKAEFIRDVLALANTAVTAGRYLVIGWDPKTRKFTTTVDPQVDQERIEDLLDRYTAPVVTVSYRPFEWQSQGTAAVLEVHSDRGRVPYRVKQALRGAKRAIAVGEVFVRHGSRVVTASDEEAADLEAERSRRTGQA